MTSKLSINSFEDDFGFSAVSEEELKVNEKMLASMLEEQNAQHQTSSERLQALHKAILPLLINLEKNPEKEYILWPDRAEKIKAFRQKIDKIVNGQ